jgi:protein arginine N-methyltransferase 1
MASKPISKLELLIKNLLIKIYSLNFVHETFHQYIFQNLRVHQLILSDEIRVNKYKKSIGQLVKKSDIVLDIGTGTGILAFFAANKAKKVYAVDYSKIIDLAKEIAIKNNLKNIVFVKSDLSNLSIPKVDLIISELIGNYVIDEGIIEKLRFAKKNFLKENGKIIPERIEINFFPVELNEHDVFWKKRYGIDFSPFQKKLSEKAIGARITKRTKFLSKDKLTYILNFYSIPKIILTEKTFKITKSGYLNGFLALFTIHLTDKMKIDTFHDITHWRQFVLPLPEQIKVRKGDSVRLKIWTTKNNSEWKWSYEIF